MSPFTSALALANAIKTKAISPVEAAKHYLDIIDRRNPELNAIIWRRDDELLKEARAAEAAVMRGDRLPAFHGVPIPIKDLTEAQGQPTTHGSRVAKNKIGKYDAEIVALMRKAGFLFLGRTNSPEFGTLPVTENALYGATRNPWNRDRTPGGSSGGAAAAVAAGMAPIAHASDGGGSIRIPASCCGLVGLKPTRARIPKGPFVSEVMHGFSTDGCVSTTVADTAAFLDQVACFDPTTWFGVAEPETPFLVSALKEPPRLRIGIMTKGPIDLPAEQSVTDAVTKTATVLSELGHEVSEAKIDWGASTEQLANDFISIWCTGTAYWDFPDWSEIEPLNAGLRVMAQRQSSADYIKAVVRLQIFSRKVVNQWGGDFDLLLTPSMAMEPPPIGWVFASGETDAAKLLWRCTEMVPYVGWCNITGQPAISLPAHVSPSGLPIGVQLVAAPYREDQLLMVGTELEKAIGWVQSLPV